VTKRSRKDRTVRTGVNEQEGLNGQKRTESDEKTELTITVLFVKKGGLGGQEHRD